MKDLPTFLDVPLPMLVVITCEDDHRHIKKGVEVRGLHIRFSKGRGGGEELRRESTFCQPVIDGFLIAFPSAHNHC